MPAWGEALAAAGMFSAFYGVAIGITQDNPKTVLAYSSVSQMGLLAAVLGMGWAAGDPGVSTRGELFGGAPHSGQGRIVSGDRRRRNGAAAPVAGAAAGGDPGAGSRRDCR